MSDPAPLPSVGLVLGAAVTNQGGDAAFLPHIGLLLSASGGVVATARPGAGRSSKRRNRYAVEIDGETFDVASPTEAVAVLEQARETAKEQAAQAMQRAAKAQKRPVRKVIADARKALPIPQITVPETLKPAAQVVLEQIQTMYAQTMRDIEVAARMAHEQRIRDLEDDDEDVLLLL